MLEHDGFRVVLDLGYGTLSRLLDVVGSRTASGIDAVVITHRHPDHMVDLHGLFRARWFGARGGAPIPLYTPEGVVQRLQGLEEDDQSAILEVFDWYELAAPEPYTVGPWTLRSWWLPHFVPNAGVQMTADGLSMAYTDDTGPHPRLRDLAEDVDLLIAEASDRGQQADTPAASSKPRMHLSAREAGQAAQAAGARRLLLTHFWPGNDRASSRREAAEVFDGEILLAEEGLRIRLP